MRMDQNWLNRIGTITDGCSGDAISSVILVEKISSEARKLSDSGCEQGTVIAIESEQSSWFLIQLLAVWQCGCVAIPISSEKTEIQRESLFKKVGVSRIINRSGILQLSCEKGSPFEILESGLILETSGSTADSKVCLLPCSRIFKRLESLHKAFKEGDLSNTLCMLPLHFGHGLIGNGLLPLLSGKNLFLMPMIEVMLPGRLFHLIDIYKISFISGTPSVWRKILVGQEDILLSKSLKRVHCASEVLAFSLFEKICKALPSATVYNVYGLTELGSWISGDTPSKQSPGSVGSGWGCSLRLVTNNEIEVLSRGIMAQCLVGDRVDFYSESSWYGTGDIGKISANGEFSIVGRLKNIINRAGEKIGIEALEVEILNHPEVDDVCVFSVKSDVVGEEVFSAIVGNVSSEDLVKWVLLRVPPSHCPKDFFKVSNIPRTARGKIDREALLGLVKEMVDI